MKFNPVTTYSLLVRCMLRFQYNVHKTKDNCCAEILHICKTRGGLPGGGPALPRPPPTVKNRGVGNGRRRHTKRCSGVRYERMYMGISLEDYMLRASPADIRKMCVPARTQKTPNLRCGFLKRRLTNIPDATALPMARSHHFCLLYTSPSPRDGLLSRMPSSA